MGIRPSAGPRLWRGGGDTCWRAHRRGGRIRRIRGAPAVNERRCGESELTIRCDPTALVEVRKRVRTVAEGIGFAEKDVSNIMLAVDEAIANVIRHGYGGPCEEPIAIRIEQASMDGSAAIQVTIRDYGRQVPPERIVGRSLDDVRPGGLGVHIIRTVMDEAVYSAAEDRGMRLVMKKKCTP